ncbi:MbnP family protein [Lishizhenia sp.]|uniref:MbnP family protein n=1 Tax=Lishizhenia sp. TaxID=2497594 RepID=UPI00299D59CD|nr:MbnP family protein [Lishizhenia sp.]MDX1447023.1 MbnP family protein [Lishizhenia sp.]
MKNIITILAVALVAMACEKEDIKQNQEEHKGEILVNFDMKAGTSPLQLRASGDTVNYDYSTALNQAFNISNFGFYVSAFTLSGPNGESYTQKMEATAEGAQGYFRVEASDLATSFINLENIPEGTYDEISFTIGVGEEGVQSGASGGVLDPANGAWFWNWNAGYIAMKVEGSAADSPQQFVDQGNGSSIPAKRIEFHVGGWKDVDGSMFVNNLKTLTLDFGSPILIGEKYAPEAHVVVDVLPFFNASSNDFTSTYSVHSPMAGAPFAATFTEMFVMDHVHQ